MLRDYQIELADKAVGILRERHIVYLNMEVRVGKTLTALRVCELMGLQEVLFLTKKKAISSIVSDYENFCMDYGKKFNLRVINYEQASKEKPEYSIIIVDEAHSLGAYPKKSLRTAMISELVKDNYLILLSGTPSPETKTQLFHQFWISAYNPFNENNFYKWAKNYVNIEQKKRNGILMNDYKNAKNEEIMSVLAPYFISYSQIDAGFKQTEVKEEIIDIEIDERIYKLCKILKKDKMYRFKDGAEIICDQAVNLQNKIHQICSGTVITTDEDIRFLDYSKADYILNNYQDKRIAIFYKFNAEGLAIKSRLKNWTDDPMEFDQGTESVFISQIQSGAMGINLSKADILVFYNIDFSATNYWQARARIQSFDRDRQPLVHWLFSKGGIERKIYNVVQSKKDYTLSYFMKDL